MDLLTGLDDVPWSELDHCYGKSDDIPGLLRTMASGSRDDAGDALSTLADYMARDGDVFELTAYLVPFFARFASAGILPADVLGYLGICASFEREQGPVRTALAASVELLTPLLGDPCEEVRRLAAWALTQCGVADNLVSHLHAQWDLETSSTVRIALLKAISVLDPALGGQLAERFDVSSADGGLCLAVAIAKVAAGMPWSDALRDMATRWVSDGQVPSRYDWNVNDDPFTDLVQLLARRGDLDAAVSLVARSLTLPATTTVWRQGTWSVTMRDRVIWAGKHLAQGFRINPRDLLQPLAIVAASEDERIGLSALELLRGLGECAVVADQLVVIANAPGPDRRADMALECLLRAGDPRTAGLLARDLRHRLGTLNAATAVRLSFDPVLLDAIRDLLRDRTAGSGYVEALMPVLGAWGAAAVPAVPDVTAWLRLHALSVSAALEEMHMITPEVLDVLRDKAAAGSGYAQLMAAIRLHALSGEEGPLVRVIVSELADRNIGAIRSAAEVAGQIDFGSARIIPALQAAIRAFETRPRSGGDIMLLLRYALWHHTGDPTEILSLITGMLGQSPSRRSEWDAIHAAAVAAELGPAAERLVPLILPLLNRTQTCAAGLLALLRIQPRAIAGIAEYTNRLIDAIELPAGSDSAINALRAAGADNFSPGAVDRLRHLADRNERLGDVRGALKNVVREDDRVRSKIRDLLAGNSNWS